MSGYQEPRNPGAQGVSVPGYQELRSPWYQESRVPGDQVPRVHSHWEWGQVLVQKACCHLQVAVAAVIRTAGLQEMDLMGETRQLFGVPDGQGSGALWSREVLRAGLTWVLTGWGVRLNRGNHWRSWRPWVLLGGSWTREKLREKTRGSTKCRTGSCMVETYRTGGGTESEAGHPSEPVGVRGLTVSPTLRLSQRSEDVDRDPKNRF